MERKGLKECFKYSVYNAEQDIIRRAINEIFDVLAEAEAEDENDTFEKISEILEDFRDVVRLYAEFEKR